MSLSSISSTPSLAASWFIPPPSTRATSNGDDTAVASTPGAGRFAGAVGDALASIGISVDGTSSTATSTAATTDGSDAIGAFLQSLLAALHGQSAGSAPPSNDAASPDQAGSTTVDASSAVSGSERGRGVGHAHHGHGGKLEADLQSLISELQSSTGTTGTTSTTGTTDITTGTTTDSALTTLEKQFDALVGTSGTSSTGGTSSNGSSLAAFLQSLAADLHGAPSTGNVVSTQA